MIFIASVLCSLGENVSLNLFYWFYEKEKRSLCRNFKINYLYALRIFTNYLQQRFVYNKHCLYQEMYVTS